MEPLFVLVGGWPASGKSTVATALADHFHLPLLLKDAVKEALMDAVGRPSSVAEPRRLGVAAVHAVLRVARTCPDGAVIDSTWFGYSRALVALLAGRCVEVQCVAPREVVRERFASRRRDERHLDGDRTESELWGEPPQALGVGPLVVVDTTTRWDVAERANEIRRVAGRS